MPSDPTKDWLFIPPPRRERIDSGLVALVRIDRHETFHDWHLIGEALLTLRLLAMEQSGANRPQGKGYNAAYKRCLGDNPNFKPLYEIDAGTRTDAVWLARHWDTVLEWHDKLKPHIRRLVNHPSTVRTRYSEDHPLPAVPRKRAGQDGLAPDSSEDDSDAEDNTEEAEENDRLAAYNIDSGSVTVTAPAPDAPVNDEPNEPINDEPDDAEWIAQFDTFWLRVPPRVQDAIAERIVSWFHDKAERAAQSVPAEVDHVEAAVTALDHSLAKEDGNRVRTFVGRKAVTSLSGEPTKERLAAAIEEELTKPDDGSNPFAKFNDDVNGGEWTAAQVLARRPTLKKGEAAIIAARHNHPDWDDDALATATKLKPSTVRRVLDKQGFIQKEKD